MMKDPSVGDGATGGEAGAREPGAGGAVGEPGEVRVLITSEPIDLAGASRVVSPSDGAVVTFAGVVRDRTGGKGVAGLSYEAYSEMARSEMRKIGLEARRRYGVGAICIVHRTGELEVGDVSVVVAVAAPHRGAAFDACEFCIDTLKGTVPIWKKERFEDGSSFWVNHP